MVPGGAISSRGDGAIVLGGASTSRGDGAMVPGEERSS